MKKTTFAYLYPPENQQILKDSIPVGYLLQCPVNLISNYSNIETVEYKNYLIADFDKSLRNKNTRIISKYVILSETVTEDMFEEIQNK